VDNNKADTHKRIYGFVSKGSVNPRLKPPMRLYWVILGLGIGFIIIGVFRSEFETILLNALILCASCIGLR